MQEVVFVGGAVTELYIEDRSQISEVRQTDDVIALCKLEALFNRGMRELRLSKDLDDIVFLLNYGVKGNADNTSLKEYITW